MTVDTTDTTGPVTWMARNPVAANLLMGIVVIGGLLGLTRTKQEVFPEFSLDVISVQVSYPGASPTEVEQGILLAVEEAVRGVDGVKRATSAATEGSGTVAIELIIGADADKALADVKTSVDRIRSFPEESEDPNVALASRRRSVISLIIAGNQELSTLHEIAEQARDELLATGEVTQVDIKGVPPLEISIEVERQDLENYGLTLQEIAQQIWAASLELPGGQIETSGGEILVRMADRRRQGHEFDDIIVRGTASGASLRLGDIARIHDGYRDTKEATFYDGIPAVRLDAYRVGAETPIGVATAVKDYAEELRASLPVEVTVATWNDNSEVLQDRISLLVRNAAMGLMLVVFILAAFLELKLAFWVAIGIPISFLGTFFLMPALGQSINMITLFALIITLGMVVDDAIIIGENSYTKLQSGLSRRKAAIEGAREMAVPVSFAILTTIAAFAPLLFVPGVMGKIFKLIPIVVITVLVFSLIESFFILPAHLTHIADTEPKGIFKLVNQFHERVSGWLERFTKERYEPLLRLALVHRYEAIAIAIAIFIGTIGLVASGHVPFSFFPRIESDVVTGFAQLPYGTPVERTKEVQRALEQAAREATGEHGGDEIVRGMFSAIGLSPPTRGPGAGAQSRGGHLVYVQIALVGADFRDIGAREVAKLWGERMPELAGIDTLTFSAAGGPGAGAEVALQLSHSDVQLLGDASQELAEVLRSYPQLKNVENTFASGKPQLDYHLLPAARTLKLTGNDVARQMRASFYGAEALREQRGRNEIKVMVRLPEEQRRSEHDLELLRVRTPAGGFVPLGSVASFERSRAPTTVTRESGRRIVDVQAALQTGVISPREVLEDLKENVLPGLEDKYAGLTIATVGAQRAQAESFKALGKNYLVAMFVIFALLAVPLKSYIQPLIVMSAIPFGIVGAVMGHLVMGYELSLMSMFGIIALSGVVVNDSLVLIDATNRARREGASHEDAIIYGGTCRLRPIVLTSLTTFFGLAPMITETSMQAKFLIPMAISLGFGVLFVTFVVLLLVPSFYLVVEDIRALAGVGEYAKGKATEPEMLDPALA